MNKLNPRKLLLTKLVEFEGLNNIYCVTFVEAFLLAGKKASLKNYEIYLLMGKLYLETYINIINCINTICLTCYREY